MTFTNLIDFFFLNKKTKIDIDMLVRKNFAVGVTRGKNELKLSDPSQTPVSNLIENAVIEVIYKIVLFFFHQQQKSLNLYS